MKTLLSLSLMALTLGTFSFLTREENISRGPASYAEGRPLSIKAERDEKFLNQQSERELQAKYDELQKKLVELETLKAELKASEEGLAQLQIYMTSPSTPLISNNESLADYLTLSEVNRVPYKTPLFSLGEMETEGEALYYGLPYSSRKMEAEEITRSESNYFYPVSNPRSSIISVY